MLDTSPTNLLDEIESAMRITGAHCKHAHKLIKDFHGSYYTNIEPDAPVPENHAYEYISLVTPKIVYSNPTVVASSRRSGVDKTLIKGIGHAVNRWSEDTDLFHTLLRIWYDLAFGFGVSQMIYEPIPERSGYGGLRPHRPVLYRLPPHRFFIDTQCDDISEARLMGHLFRRDKNDLLKDPRFNRDAIEEIAADAEISKAQHRSDTGERVKRNEIVAYEVWVPEVESADPDEGFHGTIYTVGTAYSGDSDKQAEPRWIRDPRPFYGPSWGPYKLWGVYTVPGHVLPLSPLAATEAQVRELNAHAAKAAEDARVYKRFIGYDPVNTDAGHAAREASHGEVVAVPGLGEKAIQQFELGGASEFQVKYIQMMRERVERLTGINDTQRGQSKGSKTATAESIAAQGHADRLALIQSMFQQNTADVLYSAAWYLWHGELSVMALGSDAVEDLHPRPGSLPHEHESDRVAMETGEDPQVVRQALQWNPKLAWMGDSGVALLEDDGPTMLADMDGASFDDLELKIEAYSMQRVDSAVLQSQHRYLTEILLQAIPVMAQTPYFNWQEFLDTIGEPVNQKELGDLIDLPVLQQAWAMQGYMMPGAQPMQMPMQGQPAGGVGMEGVQSGAQLGAAVRQQGVAA